MIIKLRGLSEAYEEKITYMATNFSNGDQHVSSWLRKQINQQYRKG